MSSFGIGTQVVDQRTKNLSIERDNKGTIRIYNTDDGQKVYEREGIQLVKTLDYPAGEEDIVVCITTQGEIIRIVLENRGTEKKVRSFPIVKVENCSDINMRNICFYKYRGYYILVFLQGKVLKYYFWKPSNIKNIVHQTENKFKDMGEPLILCLDGEKEGPRIIVGFKGGIFALYSPLSPFNIVSVYKNGNRTPEYFRIREIVSRKYPQEEEQEEEDYSSDSQKPLQKSQYSLDESESNDDGFEEEQQKEHSLSEKVRSRPMVRDYLGKSEFEKKNKIEEDTTDSSIDYGDDDTSETPSTETDHMPFIHDTREAVISNREELEKSAGNISSDFRKYYAIILVTICIVQVAYALYKWIVKQ